MSIEISEEAKLQGNELLNRFKKLEIPMSICKLLCIIQLRDMELLIINNITDSEESIKVLKHLKQVDAYLHSILDFSQVDKN